MKPIKVMLNGMPGNVATTIARHVVAQHGFELIPASLTGPEIEASEIRLDSQRIELIGPQQRKPAVDRLRADHGPFISVDYTHPSAVNPNAEFYCANALPFVMGTTGGDRNQLEATVRASAVPAVIAPNMAKQIVGFQAMMAYAADTFPGLFKGYTLTVKESHQKGKADTSGTARAVVEAFNRLGIDFSPRDIQMERDPERQKNRWGIPEAYLKGHGWHTYTLVAADGSVRFEFTHNVNGRDVYARGTLDAVAFLAQKVRQGEKATVFTMIDVLKAG